MPPGEHNAGSSPDGQLTMLQQMGFSLEEAARLAFKRDHFEEEVEYQERLAQQRRLQFVQWLVQSGRLKR